MTKKKTLAENMPDDRVLKCRTCSLPPDILAEVNEQKIKHGRSAHAISVGLSRMGIRLSDSAISQHFRNGHAKED